MRKLLVSFGLVSTLLGASLFVGAPDASAQPKGGAAPKGGGKAQVVDLDDEDDPKAKGADAAKGGACSTPEPGNPTEEAAQAKRLFDSNTKWAEAALALKRVVSGETGDDEGNKQTAQYHLAIALSPSSSTRRATRSSRHLRKPEPHQVQRDPALAREARDPAARARRHRRARRQVRPRGARAVQQPAAVPALLAAQLPPRSLQVPRAQLSTRRSPLQKVDVKSPYFVQAQFFSKASPTSSCAERAGREVVPVDHQGARPDAEGVEDKDRMRDLAHLSMARTYYSASVRLNEDGIPKIDAKKLSAAVKYWNRVDVASEYWLDALFEQSWAYFMAGDYPHALGNIHTLESPYFPNSFYPEAEVLKPSSPSRSASTRTRRRSSRA
jgi:hypothetical protein